MKVHFNQQLLMKLFEIDDTDNTVLLNKEWIMMIPEFNELLKRDKGSKGDYRGDIKLQARREFTYIYFYVDFGSPLRDWAAEEKHKESLKYAGIDKVDAVVMKARDHYEYLILSAARSLRTYNALMKTLDSLDSYLENIDFAAVDKKGELLNDPIKVASTIEKMDKAYTSVRNFEKRVEEDLKGENTGIRGTAELGDREATKKATEWSEQAVADRSGTSGNTGTMQGMLNTLQALRKETIDEFS